MNFFSIFDSPQTFCSLWNFKLYKKRFVVNQRLIFFLNCVNPLDSRVEHDQVCSSQHFSESNPSFCHRRPQLLWTTCRCIVLRLNDKQKQAVLAAANVFTERSFRIKQFVLFFVFFFFQNDNVILRRFMFSDERC